MEIKLNKHLITKDMWSKYPLIEIFSLKEVQINENDEKLRIAFILFPEGQFPKNVMFFDGNDISEIKNKLKFDNLSKSILHLISNDLNQLDNIFINTVGLDWIGINSIIDYLIKEKNNIGIIVPQINLITPFKAVNKYGKSISLGILKLDDKENTMRFNLKRE